MSNPARINGEIVRVKAGTSIVEIELSQDREYSLSHDQLNASKAEDVNPIYISTKTGVDPDANEGLYKHTLKPNRAVVIGPGVSLLRFIVDAGAPMFSVSPSGNMGGQW